MSSATTNGFDFETYPVEIRERSGLFFIFCKTFNIIESDSSIDKAYKKLIDKRQQVVLELSSFGIESTPIHAKTEVSVTNTTLQKWMQISIIFMCLGLPIGLFTGIVFIATKTSSIATMVKNSLKQQVSGLINNPAQIPLIFNSVATKLDNVTPERREELRYATRRIVAFVKPLAIELQQLSNDSK